MHILYHHRTAGDRVEGVHIMGMVRALREMGHSVEICSPPGCDPERKMNAHAKTEQATVTPAEGPMRRLLKKFARKGPNVLFEAAELIYNFYSLCDMTRRAWRQRPDMVLERSTSNSVAPTWLARHWGIPIVQEVNVTTKIGRLRPLVLRRVTKRLENWMARNSSVIVTVSREFKRMLAADGYPEDSIIVCQNAISPEQFEPSQFRPVEKPQGMRDCLMIGFVGSFLPWHRVDLLVESARELAPRHPSLRWALIGDGTERRRVEEMLTQYGLRELFWLPGAVKHALIPAYVCAMDVAVMPHSNAHGSPMKLFEYMAMARPVVMPDVPAIAEVIRHGENGILFRPGDAGALAGALRAVIEDEELRRRLGERARQDVLSRHTWRHNAEAVIARVAEVQERTAQERGRKTADAN